MFQSLRRFSFFTLFLFTFSMALKAVPQLEMKDLDASHIQLTIHIPVSEGNALYADSLSFSVDHPEITLSDWHPSIEPISKYDTQFKQSKKLFLEPFSIKITATLHNPEIKQATLHMMMFSRVNQKDAHHSFPLRFETRKETHIPPPPDKTDAITQNGIKSAQSITRQSSDSNRTFSQRISTMFSTTESWSLRLLLALLLGLLLSLTPCIYPMIPITVGILQTQGSPSMGRNFLMSLSYIVGIATTFALLGTTAAFTGKLFGNVMHNPFVILPIVALLIYLAGSMLGLYELYLPSFLKSGNQKIDGGSLLSTFLFGAVSGTVASPCLSPGLVLLLTFVTTMGSIPLGFALLFSFGLGLGIPLLFIGTFSSSINLLPKAGTWMLDIKQFFGFFMLATCFYFLSLILPSHLISWGFALFCLGVGIFYCASARTAHSAAAWAFKTVLGIGITAVAVYLLFYAYKQTDIYPYPIPSIWLTDYKQAVEKAKETHQKMLIDISAPHCSLCKVIDKKLFCAPIVCDALTQLIAVKIDNIEADETGTELQNKFRIMGAPTIILYDPETDQELQRWGGELYEEEPEQFAKELQ